MAALGKFCVSLKEWNEKNELQHTALLVQECFFSWGWGVLQWLHHSFLLISEFMFLSPLSENFYKRLKTWLSCCSEKGKISWDVWLLESLGVACFSCTEGHIVLQCVLSSVCILRVPSIFYVCGTEFYLNAIFLILILTGGNCDVQERHMQLSILDIYRHPITWFEFFSTQPGLRGTPGRWSTPRTAGASSVDKPERLWSESPDNTNIVSTV